jgi:hypothetical protein
MNFRYFTLFILSNLFFLANGNAQSIPMTFHNGSLKSIPLNIPGKKGKKELLFEVNGTFKKDTILQIHEIIRQKKQLSE